MIKTSAPGKLFLSGEWAVLEIGNPGIVTAVNKRVFAEIEESPSDFIEITLDDFGIKDAKAVFNGKNIEWSEDVTEEQKKKLVFVQAAIEATLQYLCVCNPFRMRSWGEMTHVSVGSENKKVGFGSSAAAVVATVAAVLKFNNHDIESKESKERIYKISTIAHYLAQGNVGSAFDVAASTYGGVFVYKRFDPKWLMEKLESNTPLKNIVDQGWMGFYVEPLDIPEGFDILVGWTKESASTSEMVKKMNYFKESNKEEYNRIYSEIAGLVKELITAWKEGNKELVLKLLRNNESLLKELGDKSGLNIETEDLKRLSELANQAGAAGKLSGAGGGDCGIAISFDKEVSEKVKELWKNNGLYIIDTVVSKNGVKAE